MNRFLWTYLAIWSATCFAAMVLYVKAPQVHAISHKMYRRFLLVPWKIITFLISAIGMVVIAPYSGDPTWDYWDALFMSVLTFTTAPWVIGVLYKSWKRRASFVQAYVASCAGFFSVSWSYDLYLLLRDGYYPLAWKENFTISSILYTLAGLLWSLDWQRGKGVVFAFEEQNWPRPPAGPVFQKLFWVALLFMIAVAGIIARFLWITKHP